MRVKLWFASGSTLKLFTSGSHALPPFQPASVVTIVCICRERWGSYVSVTIGTALTFGCAALHYIGCLFGPEGHTRFVVVLAGQVLGALGQPIFTIIPASLSGKWFPVKQREIATTIAATFNVLG